MSYNYKEQHSIDAKHAAQLALVAAGAKDRLRDGGTGVVTFKVQLPQRIPHPPFTDL